ncbi:MAG: hypothetical protein IK111_04280, partial [Lachnospiraceae bacterium]|nr:hypothetical protein [Lachnospiraceae bacterium]
MNKLNMMNIMNKTKELKKRVAVVLAASMVLVQGVPVSATEPVLPDESAEQAPAYIFWDDLDENESVRTVPIDSLDDADENVPRDGGGNDYTRYISYYYNDIHGKLTQETLSASGVSHLQQSSTSWGKNGNLFYQVTNELFIPDRVEISANEAVNLILTDNSKLICGQGIHLGPGATLTIFAQSEGENRGKLTISGNGGAGIGGNPGEGGGTVYIHGGKVTISSNGGAGIGGGNGTANQAGGDGGDVTIFGGSVNIHDVDAAGIGGGNGGAGAAGGNVRIHGGEVTIDNPKAAGIGGGNGGNGGNGNGGDGAVGGAGATVLITGGNLSINKTQNTKAAGIGGGNGGAGTNGGDGGDGGWFGVKGGKVTVTVNDPNNGNVGIGGGPGGETANNTGGNPGAGGIGSSITVSGGSVSAGSIGSEAGGGSITLGWTDISDSFYAGRYYGNIDFKLQNNKDFWYKTGKTSYTDVEVDENRQVTNINNLEGQTLYQKGSFGIKVLYENGTANGSVSVQERAFPNETVRITSNPKPGHSVCKFCVFDADDGQLPLSGYGTDFSFTMPASDVATSKLLFVPLVIVKQPEDLTLTEGYPDGYEVTILAKASNGGDCYCTWWSNNTGKNSEGEMLTDTTVSGCRIPRGYPAGTTKYYYCEVNQLTSGKIVSRVAKVTVVPKPHTHVFTPAVTTPATLFSEGLMTYTCSCGETYTETIPKLVPSSEEEAADVTQLLEDLTGTDGNLKADIDVNTKTDEDGTTVTTVTIGDQEVIKITTDEDGDETVESSIWTIGGEDEDFTYTGAAVKPVIHVYDGIHKLSEGSEYAVKYGNNVNA